MQDTMTPEERKKANLRMALVLASIAAVFFVGFMAKMAFFGH
jgi:small neutral amino acid transporter SnatA (MarC family)